MPSSVPKMRYWSRRTEQTNQLAADLKKSRCFSVSAWPLSCVAVPLVSGWIHDVAQLIFRGQPSNTLEKQAPIWNERQLSYRQPVGMELGRKLCLQNVQLHVRQSFNDSVYERRPAGKSEDNADDSPTSTLGVGGRPLIAGFWGREGETKGSRDWKYKKQSKCYCFSFRCLI